MPGSNNFLQWNPTAANQENDAAYLADSQRTGGAPNGTPFPSQTGNKLFYQLSTFVAAFGQMMSTKGYAMSDVNIATLASVLANIITAADAKPGMQNVAFSPTITLDMSAYRSFQVTLGGNVTLTIINGHAGDTLEIIFVQDGTGYHTITYPGTFPNPIQPDPNPGNVTTLSWLVNPVGNFDPQTPGMSSNGSLTAVRINQTPIGDITPAIGNFTTPAPGDTSTRAATTAWVNNLLTTTWSAGGVLSQGTATSGYLKLPAWLGGFIIQWGNVLMPGVSGSDNPTSFTFATAFPTSCLICIPGTLSSSADRITFIKSVGTTGGTISNN